MKKQGGKSLVVMESTLSRLPLYYSYLDRLSKENVPYASSSQIAQTLNLNPVTVRKDLAEVSTQSGKPRAGFEVSGLLEDLGDFLGYNRTDEALIVGVGSLGRALLTNKEFSKMGLNIVVGFDDNPLLRGVEINGKYILPMNKMEDMVRRLKIKIGIIAVPADHAQRVCDCLVKAGVKAIWNFAFVLLDVPQDVLVKNENLPASLAMLSQKLNERISEH